jgi:hypothetical protein
VGPLVYAAFRCRDVLAALIEAAHLPVTSPCPHCGYTGPSLDAGTCGRCGVIFSRVHTGGPPAEAPPEPVPVFVPEQLLARDEDEDDEEPVVSRSVARWALPLAFGVGLVLNSGGCGRLIVYASASNWAHELGHASWRWLNGRSAMPALFFTSYSQPGRSIGFTLLLLGALTALFLWARTESCVGVMGLAVGFFAIYLGLLFLPGPEEHVLESFAGLFGEFWISTLWVLLFYYRFPSALGWPRLRWAFLLLGACAYTRILGVFWASRADMTLLPWGSFFGGDGDLDRLLSAGWLVPSIRRVYFTTAGVCGALILGHYLYFGWVVDSLQERGPAGRKPARLPGGAG